MKMLEIKVMRGPNYWSNYRKKLIVMKLDLEHLEDFPTNKLDGFPERLEALMPTLYSHRCSESYKGGLFHRVRQGTWMGHVIEHIALELQSLAGMECGFGRTRGADEMGVYYVVFSYQIERAGIYAAKAAVRIAEALESDQPYNIAEDIANLILIRKEDSFGPSTQSIIDEAEKRDIPYRRLDDQSLLMLGYGSKQQMIRATVAGTTRNIAVEIAQDKEETRKILKKAFVPVPEGIVLSDENELQKAIENLGYPIVIKPLDGNHGRGVTTNIQTYHQAIQAFHKAAEISSDVIAEKYIEGHDYRLLVVNNKFVAAARRTPAMIMGDGISTVAQLIDQTNSDPSRGNHHENILTRIPLDEITLKVLGLRNMTPESVPGLGEIIFLRETANLSTGGTATDVTDIIHPSNKFLAERISRIVNLDICGIDIVSADITLPLTDGNGAVIEVNAGPGFRMHLKPSTGKSRNVAGPVIDMLFPGNSNGRIPVVAVTGTNGKTTTVRLMAHFAKQAGFNTGFTSTDGVYINDTAIYYGDCSGPASAEALLMDSLVDYAVLECARGGILRSGLAFDKCDVSIITNVSEDHLGMGGIHSMRQLARVKEVVAMSTAENGYCILNADDDRVFKMHENLDSKYALFSMDSNNERVVSHIAQGGSVSVIENQMLVVYHNFNRVEILPVNEIPLTLNGRAECMVKNVLAATLAAVVQDFNLDIIRKGLLSFIPSAEQTPGRMNIFQFRKFELMVDYAHNAGGYEELKTFLSRTKASVKTGIIAATGDRRDEDIRNVGIYAARLFDEIIIRHDKDPRGRANDEMTSLMIEGIHSIDPHKPVTVISDEIEAMRYAIQHAQPGAFIVLYSDSIRECIEFVKSEQEKDRDELEDGIYHFRTAS